MLRYLYAYICVHVHVSVGLFNASRILAHHRHVGLRIFANTKESIARCLIPILDPHFVNASPSSCVSWKQAGIEMLMLRRVDFKAANLRRLRGPPCVGLCAKSLGRQHHKTNTKRHQRCQSTQNNQGELNILLSIQVLQKSINKET